MAVFFSVIFLNYLLECNFFSSHIFSIIFFKLLHQHLREYSFSFILCYSTVITMLYSCFKFWKPEYEQKTKAQLKSRRLRCTIQIKHVRYVWYLNNDWISYCMGCPYFYSIISFRFTLKKNKQKKYKKKT